MAGDDLDDDPAPWSVERAARLGSAAADLIEAISTHAASVLAATGRPSRLGEVMSASERLVPAVLAYADAQFDYAEYAFPFGVLHQYDDEDDEEMDADEALATTG